MEDGQEVSVVVVVGANDNDGKDEGAPVEVGARVTRNVGAVGEAVSETSESTKKRRKTF